MDVMELVTVVGTIGGLQGTVEVIKWWRGRKMSDRRDAAEVIANENENDRRQIDWLENRLVERDKKIDAIYAELRAEQAAHLEDIHKLHEVEIKFAEAEIKKCHKHGCVDRIPPSDY